MTVTTAWCGAQLVAVVAAVAKTSPTMGATVVRVVRMPVQMSDSRDRPIGLGTTVIDPRGLVESQIGRSTVSASRSDGSLSMTPPRTGATASATPGTSFNKLKVIPAIRITPKLSDAELLTLAVLQVFQGFNEEARWIRHVRKHLRHLFPYVPGQAGYNKRLRKATVALQAMIRLLAQDTDAWEDDTWLIDATPVECARSRPTVKRSNLAGWASTSPTTVWMHFRNDPTQCR